MGEGPGEAQGLVAALFERLDQRDAEGVEALLDDVCEVVHPAGSRRGRDEAVDFLGTWIAAFPDGRHELRSFVQGSDGVAVEGTWRGTHGAVLSMGTGSFPPTGRAATVPFAAVAGTAEGRISSLHVYLDLLSLMTQLGLGPGDDDWDDDEEYDSPEQFGMIM